MNRRKICIGSLKEDSLKEDSLIDERAGRMVGVREEDGCIRKK